MIVGWDGWRGSMYRIAVLPARRREGIGRALVAEGERRLRAWGACKVGSLDVRGLESLTRSSVRTMVFQCSIALVAPEILSKQS